MSFEPVSMVITSYKGKELLGKFLPDVIKALETYPGGGEIVVVDDGGGDGTPEWLEKERPGIKVVPLETNIGFLLATNRGVEAARHEAVLLLNNDVSPKPDFLLPLVERLRSSEDVFAVSPRTILPDGTDEAPTRFEDDNGIFKLVQPGLHVTGEPFKTAVTIAYASGGVSLFRRDRFVELGLFDRLYRPIYFEDADISWRAWKKGWRVFYEPRSCVNHLSHATMEKYFKREWYDPLHHRNLHLFHLRHLEWDLLERYLMRVNQLQSEINLYDRGVLRRSFFKALERLGEVIERRRTDFEPIRSTAEIIELSANHPAD